MTPATLEAPPETRAVDVSPTPEPEPEPPAASRPPVDPPSRGRLLRWLDVTRGASGGWGNDPADLDLELLEETMRHAGPLFGPGRWFGLDVSGWEHIPGPPSLLVSNHSGGTTIPDVWGFAVAWYRHFGVSRPCNALAHEMVFSNPITGSFFAKRGILRANRELARRVLTEFRRDLLVLPGGDKEVWRPWKDRWTVRWSGRKGYARTAIETGVPVVPVAHAGAHNTLMVLSDGAAIARRLGLKKLVRAEIWPLHISIPWGLTLGPWPHLPLPTTLRYRIGAPITPPALEDPERGPTEAQVRDLDQTVRSAVQALLFDLRDGRER